MEMFGKTSFQAWKHYGKMHSKVSKLYFYFVLLISKICKDFQSSGIFDTHLKYCLTLNFLTHSMGYMHA